MSDRICFCNIWKEYGAKRQMIYEFVRLVTENTTEADKNNIKSNYSRSFTTAFDSKFGYYRHKSLFLISFIQFASYSFKIVQKQILSDI